jgi:hypothetical protein
MSTHCEHDGNFVDDVMFEEVIALAMELFLGQRRR